MNVYLDAQPLLGPRSGIARYVECLSKQLATQDLDVHLAFNRIVKAIHENHVLDLKRDFHLHLRNNVYPYKVIRRLLRPNFLYHMPYDMLSKAKADIFHGTNFTYTPTWRGKSIITIHDLAYMRYPDATSERILKHHSNWVPYSAQQCDHIIADSLQTKQDIIELLHIPEDKIDVVYLAADEHFRFILDSLPVLTKYKLPEKFILFVGTLEPRKNLLGLLKSYLLLKQNWETSVKLVIVGAKGWKYGPIFEWVQKHQLEEEIIFTGFIDDDDLPAIYSAASAFVMPSIYEGFGLPLLEAMQCGTPVIGSNISSIPEIIGDGGVLIPPDDDLAWAESMHTMISNTQIRSQYSQLALQRASNFTWEKTAAETKKIYLKVLNDQ
ncbi:glycosyltransferase family 4 protein [Paenibacillus doosanensis]|uniref:glycosyltransferase family 4 protein n=1 Tax=Paenibacillus doosanensis TaxID=1229154 RepID=UPI00217FD82B|nr:glycosyltransferase family 1 protein [Paenibacillus doosanensis]MCS7464258.1 glycosyltransferase family 4 protein [Paenibacillus doosanensis]